MVATLMLMVAGCSYVRTDGVHTTAWTLGGRGSMQAPGMATTYDNDESVASVVGAAESAITIKAIADAGSELIDEIGDINADNNATSTIRAGISARENIAVRSIRLDRR
jgi:hypothetical protein